MRIALFISEIIIFACFIIFKTKMNKPCCVSLFILMCLFAIGNIYYNFDDIANFANKVKTFLITPTTAYNDSASLSQITTTTPSYKQFFSVISSFTSSLLALITFYNNFLKKELLNIEQIKIGKANYYKMGREKRKISLLHKSEKFSLSKVVFPVRVDFYICLDTKTFNDDEYRENLKDNKYKNLFFRKQSLQIYDENRNDTVKHGDYLHSSFTLDFNSNFFDGFLPSEIENNFEIINKMLIFEIEYKVISKNKYIRFFQKALAKKKVQTFKFSKIKTDASGDLLYL